MQVTHMLAQILPHKEISKNKRQSLIKIHFFLSIRIHTVPLVIVFTPHIFTSKNDSIHNMNCCRSSLSFALITGDKNTHI